MIRAPRSRLVRLVAVLLPLVALGLASAAPGDLDPTFNALGAIPGVVVVDVDPVGPVPEDFDRAAAMVIQPDGKIVVGGAAGSRFALIRLNSDGSLDSTFGVGGKVFTNGISGELTALALQPLDGKIVAVGHNSSAPFQFVVIRYNANGSPDTTFDGDGDNDGVILTPFPGGQAFATAVVLQDDGKIVVAGSAGADVALARYTSNGSLDNGFGPDLTGQIVTDFGAEESVHAAVLQGDKIVVGGMRRVTIVGPPASNPGDFFLARYDTSGDVDGTFGSSGLVTTDFSDLRPAYVGDSSDIVTGLAVQPDGKIVAAGYFEQDNGGGDAFLLARYDALDGSLDPAFGNAVPLDGRATGPSGSASAVVLQLDGKIVAGGFQVDASDVARFGVTRYDADGSLDASFGTGGIVTTDLGGSQFPLVVGVGIQTDGKIVAAGMGGSAASTDLDFVVARYVVQDTDTDTTPPTIESASVSPSVLWPPDHRMVPVRVWVSAHDDSDAVTCAIVSIRSNERVDGRFDGHTSPDWVITGALTAELRAERSWLGFGRVYTLAVRCQDDSGNEATKKLFVRVPYFLFHRHH
jgi:uncharacterized delta-60 repeat protein